MSIKKPCAYCGIPSDKRDREHVFPKNLYPTSKRGSKTQRLTIPACNKCNNSWADDEAHFRNMLVIAGDPANEIKVELWKTTISRSFNQIDGFRRLKDLSEQMKPVLVNGKERYKVYPGKDIRVERVIKKIVRGLCYYHEIETPITEDEIFVDVLKYEIPEWMLNEMVLHEERDSDIVAYRYIVLNQDDMQSMWLITFYRTVTFISIVTIN
jgi:hypothetical protein